MNTKQLQPNTPVEVRIPKVNLRIDDLEFLRSLFNPNGVRCHIPSHRLSRLRYLGLIEEKMVPPGDKERKEILKSIAEQKRIAAKEFKRDNWRDLRNMLWALENASGRLEPRKTDVLTAKGRTLLERGLVTVRINKKGCA